MTPTRILASLLGLAILLAIGAAIAGPMPPDYLAAIAALPAGLLVSGAVLIRRNRGDIVMRQSRVLLAGLVAGLAATAVYDLYRLFLALVVIDGFVPFRVQPVFGRIITGQPSTHPLALAAGWAHHAWLGAILGMVFAAIRPAGGMLAGAIFIALIQTGRWILYPDVFLAGLAEAEFLLKGVIGPLAWGATAGVVTGSLGRRLGHQPPQPQAR